MGGLALVELTVPEEGLRVVLQIFVVVIGFALMAFWKRGNRVALELDECRRRSGPVRHGRVASTHARPKWSKTGTVQGRSGCPSRLDERGADAS